MTSGFECRAAHPSPGNVQNHPLQFRRRSLCEFSDLGLWSISMDHPFWRRFLGSTRLHPMMHRALTHTDSSCRQRLGQATLDFILIVATMLPIVLFIVSNGKRTMQLVWEMLCVQLSWPFL